jgi:hypothetical protein
MDLILVGDQPLRTKTGRLTDRSRVVNAQLYSVS